MMRRAIALLLTMLAFECLTAPACIFGRKAGMGKYRQVLERLAPGLCPFCLPNADDGPGTILVVVTGYEQLYYQAKNAFPGLKADTSEVPAAMMTEVADIDFRVGAKLEDGRVLPPGLSAAAKQAYKASTTVAMSVKKPRLVRIDQGLFNEAMRHFDYDNQRHMAILEKLREKNARLVCGALLVDGLEFTFKGTSAISETLMGEIRNAGAECDMGMARKGESQFTVTAGQPAYLAYYAYGIKREKIDKIIEEITRKHAEAELKRQIDSLKSELDSRVEYPVSENYTETILSALRRNKRALKDSIAGMNAQLPGKAGEAYAMLKQMLDRLAQRLSDNNKMIKEIEQGKIRPAYAPSEREQIKRQIDLLTEQHQAVISIPADTLMTDENIFTGELLYPAADR